MLNNILKEKVGQFAETMRDRGMPVDLCKICVFVALCDQNRARSEEYLDALIENAETCKDQDDFTDKFFILFDIPVYDD